MIWNNIKPLCAWVNLAVPTIFGDALSFEEDLGKINFKLNELIGGYNQIPAYVQEQIANAFDASGIGEQIKEILANSQLDVTNPPNDLPPADKTGKTDSTQALQRLIDYAASLPYPQNLYFPAGVYQISSLILRPNVSFTGDGAHFTVLLQSSFATEAMLTGTLQNALLQGFTFDDNNVTKETNTMFHFSDFSNSILLNNVFNGQNSEIVIEKGSNGIIRASEFRSVAIYNNQNQLYVESNVFSNCPNAIINYGNGCYFNGNYFEKVNQIIINHGNSCNFEGYSNDTANYTDDGNNNNYDLLNIVSKKAYREMMEEITGEKTVQAGDYNLNVDGELSASSSSSLVTVINKREENYGDLETRITGKKSVVAKDIEVGADKISIHSPVSVDGDTDITGNVSVDGDTNITGDVSVSKNVDVNGTTNIKDININGNITASAQVMSFQGNDFKINSKNPITYGVPQRLNDTYKYVPFKNAQTGDNYQVMVYDGKDPAPPEPGETHSPTYINIKDYGAVGDGTTNDTAALLAASGFNGYIYFPYGTYLIDTVTLPDNIKGIIGEMSTIKSTTENDMLTAMSPMFTVQSILLDASSAAAALVANNGASLDNVVCNRNIITGTLFMRSCRFNNNCTISSQNTSIAGSILNANITFKQGFIYEITGNSLSGSFVIETTEPAKVAGAAITGNYFSNPITLNADYFTLLRISGNVNLEDYPKIVIPDPPEPTPPFNYQIPNSQMLTFLGVSADKNYWIYTDNGGKLYIRPVAAGALTINPDGTVQLEHTVNQIGGNYNLSTSNSQIFNFKNFKISQNSSNDELYIIFNDNGDPLIVLKYPNINDKNIVVNATTRFNNDLLLPTSNRLYFGTHNSDYSHLLARDLSSYKLNFGVYQNGQINVHTSVTKEGVWTFTKNINAPNIGNSGATYLGGTTKTLSKESTYPISFNYLGISSVPPTGSLIMLVIIVTNDYSGTVECTTRYNPGQVQGNIRYIYSSSDNTSTIMFSLWCPASSSAPNAQVNLALYKLN